MKLRLTESQFDRIQKKLNEGAENSYSRTVQVSFYYHKAKINNFPIDSVMDTNITMKFTIEMEVRQWGIKDIVVGNIQGPSEIELDIDYWPNESEVLSTNMPLGIDWSIATIEKETGRNIISVGDEIEIYLVNNEEGKLVVQKILIPVYGL